MFEVKRRGLFKAVFNVGEIALRGRF